MDVNSKSNDDVNMVKEGREHVDKITPIHVIETNKEVRTCILIKLLNITQCHCHFNFKQLDLYSKLSFII